MDVRDAAFVLGGEHAVSREPARVGALHRLADLEVLRDDLLGCREISGAPVLADLGCPEVSRSMIVVAGPVGVSRIGAA